MDLGIGNIQENTVIDMNIVYKHGDIILNLQELTVRLTSCYFSVLKYLSLKRVSKFHIHYYQSRF